VARLNRNHGEEGGGNKVVPSPYETQTSTVHALPPTPEIGADLINYLNAAFPDALPPVGAPYVELERAWGRREVIAHLIRIKQQNEQDNTHVHGRIISSSGAGGSASSGPGGSHTGPADLQ
jgi:uncharacterized membrane protein YgcG